MEFRGPSVATQRNAKQLSRLTDNLTDKVTGVEQAQELFKLLGNAIDYYPDWHPIITIPQEGRRKTHSDIVNIKAYDGLDHNYRFVRGFLTCPYSEDESNKIVDSVNKFVGLHAFRLDIALYSDATYPVVVEATDVITEHDGTIRGQDALRWFVKKAAEDAQHAQVGETWWNVRSSILGRPSGSRSSTLVGQNTGLHMRKILEAMNNSGVFGPVVESSLDMLSAGKRAAICENLIRSAIFHWNKKDKDVVFEFRGYICKATMRDTWKDGHEISADIEVGNDELHVSGFYYPENDYLTYQDPQGKRLVAEKFT